MVLFYRQLDFNFLEDIMASVSNAEIEKFKAERIAEREFLEKVQVLVSEFAAKVSSQNSKLRSMQRFLKASV